MTFLALRAFQIVFESWIWSWESKVIEVWSCEDPRTSIERAEVSPSHNFCFICSIALRFGGCVVLFKRFLERYHKSHLEFGARSYGVLKLEVKFVLEGERPRLRRPQPLVSFFVGAETWKGVRSLPKLSKLGLFVRFGVVLKKLWGTKVWVELYLLVWEGRDSTSYNFWTVSYFIVKFSQVVDYSESFPISY